MYTSVSDNYKTTINGYSRRFTARLKRDGDILAAEIKSYSLGKYSSTGEDYCIGCAFSSSATISCITDVPLKDREVVLETGLYIGNEVEYVPDGVYTIVSAKKKDMVTELTGYDRMYTAGQNAFQTPELPCLLSAAAASVAEQLGCGFDSACMSGVEDLTLETMPAGTLSDISGYLAGLLGRNAYIDRAGQLTFKGYTDSGYEFDGNRISDMNADSSARKINWLECTAEGADVLQSGTGSGYIRMQNPMMTQTILDNITAGIAGFSYYGAEIPFLLGDNRLDPWDIIHYQYLATGDALLMDENGYILTDEFGNVFVDLLSDSHQISVCCHEITWKFDGGLSMDINSYALSESEENTNFRGPMQAQVDQANRTAAEAKKGVSDLDKRLTQKEILDRLTNNGKSQGLFRDEKTGDLYINASYIVSGILSSLGGESWINLENGTFQLKNGLLDSVDILESINIKSAYGFVFTLISAYQTKGSSPLSILVDPNQEIDGGFWFKCETYFDNFVDFMGDVYFHNAPKMLGGSYTHTAEGTSGSTGYVLAARMTISTNYQNVPIIFHILQRGVGETTLQIRFKSVANTDPELGSFTYSGGQAAYLVKSDTSTWDLYIQKTQAYDKICVSEYYKAPYDSGITVTWMDEHASSLPAGYVLSSAYVPHDSGWINAEIDTSTFALYTSSNPLRYRR
ncbi:MAG: hypothetical protein MR966_13440, partial [Lachnospiraceae bacterium]|nr:hypothetical protein [Lachnospiraceae bacterium]